MGRVRFAVRHLSLALALFWTSSGLAQAQPEELVRAQTLFDEGLVAAERDDWAVACDRFEESNRLDPAPGTMMNLGRCRSQLGELVKAWESYRRAAEAFGAEDPRAQFASNEAQDLERRVPLVTFSPPATETPFLVIVEGSAIEPERLGVPLPFDPGTLQIIVRARGHQDWVQRLGVEEGARVEQQLALGAALLDNTQQSPPVSTRPAAAGGARSEPPEIEAIKSAAPIIVASFAVGGVGVALGAFGGVWAALETPRVRAHCDDQLNCDRRGFDAARRGRVATILGVSGAGLAVVGLSVGTVFLTAKQSTSLSLVPMVGGTMLSLQGNL